jgi:NAD(P)-dependent dehydrogenase (short-subunit alcohol dehydrogenase family)
MLRAGIGAYAASKAGLNALTSSLAAEVIDYNITVNALLPTIIDSPANRVAMPKSDPSRWVLPEQLAEIAHSLASRWGDPINGALIPVSGRV